jgi:hypothetical protein
MDSIYEKVEFKRIYSVIHAAFIPARIAES